MSNLVNIIEQVFAEDPQAEEAKKSAYGSKLLDAVAEYRRRATGRVITPDELSDIEKKIAILRAADEKRDLAWMDMRSWYVTPLRFRRKFIDFVDPFIFDGIYFELSIFTQCGGWLLPELGDNVCFSVIDDWGSSKFIAVRNDKCYYDSLGQLALIDLQRRVRSRQVASYGHRSLGGNRGRGHSDQKNPEGVGSGASGGSAACAPDGSRLPCVPAAGGSAGDAGCELREAESRPDPC